MTDRQAQALLFHLQQIAESLWDIERILKSFQHTTILIPPQQQPKPKKISRPEAPRRTQPKRPE